MCTSLGTPLILKAAGTLFLTRRLLGLRGDIQICRCCVAQLHFVHRCLMHKVTERDQKLKKSVYRAFRARHTTGRLAWEPMSERSGGGNGTPQCGSASFWPWPPTVRDASAGSATTLNFERIRVFIMECDRRAHSASTKLRTPSSPNVHHRHQADWHLEVQCTARSLGIHTSSAVRQGRAVSCCTWMNGSVSSRPNSTRWVPLGSFLRVPSFLRPSPSPRRPHQRNFLCAATNSFIA